MKHTLCYVHAITSFNVQQPDSITVCIYNMQNTLLDMVTATRMAQSTGVELSEYAVTLLHFGPVRLPLSLHIV